MKTYSKWTVLVLTVLFFGGSILCWVSPAKSYSVTERRKLEQFPKFTMESILDGTFMTEFEKYSLDQFPLRDGFRSLKAWVSQYVFQKWDNNDIYVAEGYAVKMEYPLKKQALEYAGERFENVYEKYLKNSGSHIYLSLIPDKNFFLAESSGHLSMDYGKLFEIMQAEMPYAEYIEISDLLEIEDFYKTDVHWRQEKIVDAADNSIFPTGTTIRFNLMVNTQLYLSDGTHLDLDEDKVAEMTADKLGWGPGTVLRITFRSYSPYDAVGDNFLDPERIDVVKAS